VDQTNYKKKCDASTVDPDPAVCRALEMTEAAASPSPVSSTPRKLLGWAGFAAVVVVCCELGARLDDLFFEGVPFFANPSYEAMFTIDEHGLRRGKPKARWKRVALNNLGMRGEDVPARSAEGCQRWMFLGASETFGEPSMADAEFPARVRALARQHSLCVDVMNTAYPGIPPRTLRSYYTSALSQYAPDVVFIYASTHFYLAEAGDPVRVAASPPPPPPPVQTDEPWSVGSLLAKSRFLERMKDTAEVPASIQKMRLRRWIEAASAGKPKDWAFDRVPEQSISLLQSDLRELVAAIHNSGATPVLLTHAVRVTDPPRADDHTDLYSMRRYVPRASEQILAAFEYQAAEAVRKLGEQEHVRVIDVARLLNGRRDQFIDLVHLTEKGHDAVAQLVVREMIGADSHAVQ
jgi:hypothetical protein